MGKKIKILALLQKEIGLEDARPTGRILLPATPRMKEICDIDTQPPKEVSG